MYTLIDVIEWHKIREVTILFFVSGILNMIKNEQKYIHFNQSNIQFHDHYEKIETHLSWLYLLVFLRLFYLIIHICCSFTKYFIDVYIMSDAVPYNEYWDFFKDVIICTLRTREIMHLSNVVFQIIPSFERNENISLVAFMRKNNLHISIIILTIFPIIIEKAIPFIINNMYYNTRKNEQNLDREEIINDVF